MQDAQHGVGVVRLHVAARSLGDVVNGGDVAALQRPSTGGHQPIFKLPIHAPANGHAIDRERIHRQLLRGVFGQGVAKLHLRCPGRIQDGGAAFAADAVALLRQVSAVAGHALKAQAEGHAVDGGQQVGRVALGIAAKVGGGGVVQAGLPAPCPALVIQAHAKAVRL